MTDDTRIKEALTEANNYLADYDKENEHTFSRRIQRKIRRLIGKEKAPISYRVKSAAAIIVLTILLGGTLVLSFSETARAAVLTWFSEVFEGTFLYRGTKESETAVSGYSIKDLVPEEYTYSEKDSFTDASELFELYTDSEGYYLCLNVFRANDGKVVQVLTDEGDKAGQKTICDYRADWYYDADDESNAYVWTDESGTLFYLGGHIDEKNLSELAERFIRMNKGTMTIEPEGKAQTMEPDCEFTVDLSEYKTGTIKAGVAVHDPSVVQEGDKFYIFGSHMTCAVSEDLRTWKTVGDGYKSSNKVYGKLFSDDEHVFRYAGKATSVIPTDDGGCHLWAPDVIYNKKMGKYVMYYSASSTWSSSCIGFATADSIEGPYEYAGDVVCSGYTVDSMEAAGVLEYVDADFAKNNYLTGGTKYNHINWPNCIDPTIFYDKDGRMWIVYGSWSGGIFLLEIDEETGMAIRPEADPDNRVDHYYGRKLIGGGHKSIEGPYILYDSEADYYYLFVSYGNLTANGGYQIRVFRSKTVDGDYLDMNDDFYMVGKGKHVDFGLKLSGNYRLPSLAKAYMATGHNSAMIAGDGKRYIVHHTRFENSGEFHEPRVKQFFINKEGWPCMMPYATDGETISETGYKLEELAGKYYVIDQGTGVDSEIAEPVIMWLKEDGSVLTEAGEGTWSIEEGTYYMNIKIAPDREYSGVFCAQRDEAGTDVMVFTAVGANESLWGVKY